VIGTGRINGSLILTSDERLKENIVPLNQVSGDLIKLSAVQYNLKSTTEDIDFGEKEFILRNDTIKMRKNEFSPEFYNRKRIGFLAQDVREIFPELVFEDSLGILSIDYIGLIPVVVETVKEQQQQIEVLQGLVQEQEMDIIKIKEKIGLLPSQETKKSAEAQASLEDPYVPVLYQNNPNPFTKTTEITIYLPENVSKAQLYVHDLNGVEVKVFDISERGQVKTEIHANTLKKGIYLYSLVVDGNQVDSKRMILTD